MTLYSSIVDDNNKRCRILSNKFAIPENEYKVMFISNYPGHKVRRLVEYSN